MQVNELFYGLMVLYSHAKLNVNGQYVREHHGGFTCWETDITRINLLSVSSDIPPLKDFPPHLGCLKNHTLLLFPDI